MVEKSYKQSLNHALKELSELMSQREELEAQRETLDKEIMRLRDGILGLATLCGMDSKTLGESYPELFPDLMSPDTGMTDAIREVLKYHNVFYSPVEVRNRIKEKGFPVENYKNILASIHTILKRLVKSGELVEASREGKVVYKWKI